MKRLLILLVTGLLGFGCEDDEPKSETVDGGGGGESEITCEDVDGVYETAKTLDQTLGYNAQKLTAAISDSDGITINAVDVIETGIGGSNAKINKEERWVETTYAFTQEEIKDPICETTAVDVVISNKMKTMEHVVSTFELDGTGRSQGTCADVQQVVYDAVLDSLTPAQLTKYQVEGKKLTFLKDDDVPELSGTNPVLAGPDWLSVDPGDKVTQEGDTFVFEPWSLYVVSDSPHAADSGELLRGVRYCKMLSHQGIARWMLEESFKAEPVLLEKPEETTCSEPSSFDSPHGSCIFYFVYTRSVFCEEYTGLEGVTSQEQAEEACVLTADHFKSATEHFGHYGEKPCSERTDELMELVPNYEGFLGACVVDCQTPNEFVWNVYAGDLAAMRERYPCFDPDQIAEIKAGK